MGKAEGATIGAYGALRYPTPLDYISLDFLFDFFVSYLNFWMKIGVYGALRYPTPLDYISLDLFV